MTIRELRSLIQDMPDSAAVHFHDISGDLTANEWWASDDGAHICLLEVPTGVTGLANETPVVQQGHPDSIGQ